MTTHGMTAALRHAELLAESVSNGARAHQPSIGTYQDTRDRLSLPMLEVAEQIASFGWDLMAIRDLLRKMSSAMTDEVETLADLGNAAGQASSSLVWLSERYRL